MDIDQVKEFLMWCSIINISLLTISGLMMICLGGLAYRIHSKLFGISREAFNVMLYSFLGAYKILVIMFNVVPWIALLIVT